MSHLSAFLGTESEHVPSQKPDSLDSLLWPRILGLLALRRAGCAVRRGRRFFHVDSSRRKQEGRLLLSELPAQVGFHDPHYAQNCYHRVAQPIYPRWLRRARVLAQHARSGCRTGGALTALRSSLRPGPTAAVGAGGPRKCRAPDSVLIRCCSAAAGRWFVRTARSHKLKTYLCVTGSASSARPRASSRGRAVSICCVDARLLSRGPAACRVPSGGRRRTITPRGPVPPAIAVVNGPDSFSGFGFSFSTSSGFRRSGSATSSR